MTNNAITYVALFAALVITLGIPCIITRANRKMKQTDYYDQPRADIKPYSPPQPRPKPKPAKAPVKLPKEKRGNKASPETIAALHAQADAEMHIAEAIESRIGREHDPIKRARLEKQAALAWVRFCNILDKIDKLTPQ